MPEFLMERRKLRILLVAHGLFPQSVGGTEIYTYYLARELHRRNQVYVFHRQADPAQEEYAVTNYSLNGMQVTSINNNFRKVLDFSMTYKNDIIAGIFTDFLDQVRPDIVHFQHLICLSTSLVSACQERNIPTVLTLHDYWFLCQRSQLLRPDLSICSGPEDRKCADCLSEQLSAFSTPLRRHSSLWSVVTGKRGALLGRIASTLRALYVQLDVGLHPGRAVDTIQARTDHIREMLKGVNLLITPSRFHRTQHIALGARFGITPERIHFSDNGMNTGLFADFQKKPADRLRFGFMGSIIPSKGLHVLIKAFNRVSQDAATLRIHGVDLPYDGYETYPQDVRRMVMNPNIQFMGGFSNAQVPRVLSEIDVLIVPSIWYENSPLTIHEAFVAKIPVIASNIGGMAEYVHHMENGLLFQVGDHEDLNAKINAFIEDPNLVERLSGNIGPVKTIEENAEELEEIYGKLITQSR